MAATITDMGTLARTEPLASAADAWSEQSERDALAYLHRAVAACEPVAVLTGSVHSGRTELVRRFVREAGTSHVAQLTVATHDPRAFLEELLAQLGFDQITASTQDLCGLITMFIRHEAALGRRSLIVLEQAEKFGPKVLNVVQTLATAGGANPSPVTFLLTGSEQLNRVLNSNGMEPVAHLTGSRRHLPDRPANLPPKQRPPVLLVSHDSRLLGHRQMTESRLMIGRHPQNDLSIDSCFVSRYHAILLTGSEGHLLVDLRSTNGTYVNSIGIQQHLLKHGDVISIGDFQLKYLDPAAHRTPRSVEQAAQSLPEIGPEISAESGADPAEIASRRH